MSRLIVKNLPAYLTQAQLRSHFEAKDGPGGTLTDVKVVLKPDGTSRRFGFVGFKTDAEAQKAQKWFDRTFIHSSRISVAVIEVCLSMLVYVFTWLIQSAGHEGCSGSKTQQASTRRTISIRFYQ